MPLAFVADAWADLLGAERLDLVALAGAVGASPAIFLVLAFVSGASAGLRAFGLALVFTSVLVSFACVGLGFVLGIRFVAIGETSSRVNRELK